MDREEYPEHIDITYGDYNYKMKEKLANKKTNLKRSINKRQCHFLKLLTVAN